MESSVCHSTSPDIILNPVCLNIFLRRSYRLLSLGPHLYTLQICHTFVKWPSQLELLEGSDNQTDCLIAALSLCPLDAACQPPKGLISCFLSWPTSLSWLTFGDLPILWATRKISAKVLCPIHTAMKSIFKNASLQKAASIMN